MQIIRHLQKAILEQCFKGKVIVLLGARQVGKTTLMRQLQKMISKPSAWLNADEADIFKELSEANTSTRLMQLIGTNNQLVFIDEAQQIPNIGKKLKLLNDTYPSLQVIVTGSSSFELQDKMSEPLTGRKREFYIYPIGFGELVDTSSILEEKRSLNQRLIFGSYPEVLNHSGNEKTALLEIANSYLYKDVLQLEGIRKATVIQKLLQAIALQLGHEVRYHELSKTIGNIDPTTVEKYLDILEKAFIIYKLPTFSRIMRNEIKKGKKYYFYDNGIRNVLISNFSSIEMRQDVGALWENYILSERMKYIKGKGLHCDTYFWRTIDQSEIDYIEEYDGILHAHEIKWKLQKIKFPSSFINSYPDHTTQVIHRENYDLFLGYS